MFLIDRSRKREGMKKSCQSLAAKETVKNQRLSDGEKEKEA